MVCWGIITWIFQTKWFERQISIAKKAKKVKATLVQKLKGVYDYGIKFPE